MVDDFRGRGGSPWGSPPGGGNGSGRKGPTPPDIDEIIRNIQDKINKFMPGGAAKGGKPIIFGLIILKISGRENLTDFKNSLTNISDIDILK